MSHRGSIAVRQPDGRYSLTLLHSCSYPATIWGDQGAGEILLRHHDTYPQALALSSLPQISRLQPVLSLMLPPQSLRPEPRTPLERRM